jgi:hypothetical protein
MPQSRAAQPGDALVNGMRQRHRPVVIVLEDDLDENPVDPLGPRRLEQHVGVWEGEHAGLDPDPAFQQDVSELNRARLGEVERHDVRSGAPGPNRLSAVGGVTEVDVLLSRTGNLELRDGGADSRDDGIVSIDGEWLHPIRRPARMQMHRSRPGPEASTRVEHQLLKGHRHIRMILATEVAVERALDHP